MSPHPTICTHDLVLRSFDIEDASALEEAATLLDVTSSDLAPSMPEISGEAIGWVHERVRLWRSGLGVSFAIARASRVKVAVGEVQFIRDLENESAELGFWVHPAWQGKGIAQQAVGVAVRWAMTTLACHRVYARTEADNLAAQRVMVSAGMRREGTWRDGWKVAGQFVDIVWYGALANDVTGR